VALADDNFTITSTRPRRLRYRRELVPYGVYICHQRVSITSPTLLNATDQGRYCEPGLTDAEARALLLPVTLLPGALSLEGARKACLVLRLDAAPGLHKRRRPSRCAGQIERARRPTPSPAKLHHSSLQPRGANRHAVFSPYVRDGAGITTSATDRPAFSALTLEVDDFGNVRKRTPSATADASPSRIIRSRPPDDGAAHLHRNRIFQRHQSPTHVARPREAVTFG
jgi:hypothetical protein